MIDKIKAHIEDYIKKIKKKHLVIAVFFLVLISGLSMLMTFNYAWYDDTIVKVQAVENQFSHEKKINQYEVEKYYTQTIQGLVKNGPQKGQEVEFENTYSSSGVYDEKYQVGDDLFVELGSLVMVKSLKRDKYMVLPLAILVMMILVFMKKKGLLTLISLAINISIFVIALDLYQKGHDILALSHLLIILFTIISLTLTNGFKFKTLAAILSSLATLGVMVLAINFFVSYSNDIDYAYMDYVYSPKDLGQIFKAQLIIAGLGAIMDIAIMMTALVQELVRKNPRITVKALWRSGRELGHDVMGAMLNVMLFTYLCGSIPVLVLKMKMDISLTTLIRYHMPMELYRFLFGGIGIIIAVPISLTLSILLIKKWRVT